MLRVLHLLIGVTIDSCAAAYIGCRGRGSSIGHHVVVAAALFIEAHFFVRVLDRYELTTQVVVAGVVPNEAVEFELGRYAGFCQARPNRAAAYSIVCSCLLLAVWAP